MLPAIVMKECMKQWSHARCFICAIQLNVNAVVATEISSVLT